jgi:hypothetical protein
VWRLRRTGRTAPPLNITARSQSPKPHKGERSAVALIHSLECCWHPDLRRRGPATVQCAGWTRDQIRNSIASVLQPSRHHRLLVRPLVVTPESGHANDESTHRFEWIATVSTLPEKRRPGDDSPGRRTNKEEEDQRFKVCERWFNCASVAEERCRGRLAADCTTCERDPVRAWALRAMTRRPPR